MIYKFVRGDTFAFKVLLKTKNNIILKKEDVETIYITARKNTQENGQILFQKDINDISLDENGYCHAKFNPEDTETLKYGTYLFDVEITLKSGYRKSKLYKFEITKETTIHRDGGVI